MKVEFSDILQSSVCDCHNNEMHRRFRAKHGWRDFELIEECKITNNLTQKVIQRSGLSIKRIYNMKHILSLGFNALCFSVDQTPGTLRLMINNLCEDIRLCTIGSVVLECMNRHQIITKFLENCSVTLSRFPPICFLTGAPDLLFDMVCLGISGCKLNQRI